MLICLCILKLFPLICTTYGVNIHNAWNSLQSKSLTEIIEEYEQHSTTLWSPNTRHEIRPNANFIRHYNINNFWNLISEKIKNPNFSWSSIDLLTLANEAKSYVILGGSVQSHTFRTRKNSIFPRIDGIVMVCIFTSTLDGQIKLEKPCHDLSKGIIPSGFIGASVLAAKLTKSAGLLAYCDPHWTNDSSFPAGRCFLQLIINGTIQKRLELNSFCQTGGRVTEPCMTGFSLGIRLPQNINYSVYQAIKTMELFVGQPLASSFGRGKIILDPYNLFKTNIIQRESPSVRESFGGYFGFAYSDQFISAPFYGEEDLSYWPERKLIRISYLNNHDESGSNTPNLYGIMQANSSFTGFGTSLLRLYSNMSKKILVVGAPYATYSKGQANRGVIYLYCMNDNLFRKNASQDVQAKHRDVIFGPPDSTFFGFSISNIGDIDGDGLDDLAVGAPSLNDTSKPGKVFIISVFPNCSFNRQPLEVLRGPKNESYFGALLPPKSADLTLNGWPDLVIPIPNCVECRDLDQNTNSPVIYSSRPKYHAVCTFDFPNWLRNFNVDQATKIQISIAVHLTSTVPSRPRARFSEILSFGNMTVNKLIHQVNPDTWAENSNQQRLKLEELTYVNLDTYSDKLHVFLALRSKYSAKDMPSLQKSDGVINVQYRYIMPCLNQINGTILCDSVMLLRRPIIDWSDCNVDLPINRYICSSREECYSDVRLRVQDALDRKNVIYANFVNESRTSGETTLIYGDEDNSKLQLILEVYNYGPNFVYGARLNLRFFGNLQISALETKKRSHDGQSLFSETICNHPSNDETRLSCVIEELEPPISLSENGSHAEENLKPVIYFRLSSFYNTHVNTESSNFMSDSGVNISIVTSSWYPANADNTLVWKYILKHVPKIIISTDFLVSSSIIDNRLMPFPSELARYQRVWLDEIGPSLQQAFQIENLGPKKRLNNVTLRINIPIASNVRGSLKSLVYLFDEVRSPSKINRNHEWFSVSPYIRMLGSEISPSHSCKYSSRDLINTNRLVGIYLRDNNSHRIRRDVERIKAMKYSNSSISHKFVDNEFKASTLNTVSFRKTQKEVIQCGRFGGYFGSNICLEIVCHLDELVRQQPVLLIVNGWLYARTFFEHSISDVEIVTSLTVDQGDVPEGVLSAKEPASYFELSQTFFFSQIEAKVLSKIPIWPIVVGLNIGIILLAIMIIILYSYGFFRRSKSELVSIGKATNVYPVTVNSDYGYSFGTLTTLEEARRRRRKIKRHPRDVSILHPDDLRNAHINLVNEKLASLNDDFEN